MKDSGTGTGDPLVALRQGDPGPFEAFVSSETGRFLGFFARLGATRPEAEDLVQETFLKLFRLASKNAPNSGHGYHEQGRFDAYSFRVARNVWIDHSRRRGTQPASSAHDAFEMNLARDARREGARAAQPGESLEAREESDRIHDAVAQLGDAHRIVFELGIIQELPYTDIANALEIPIGTVKSRMFHAVRKVREHLSTPELGGGGARAPQEKAS